MPSDAPRRLPTSRSVETTSWRRTTLVWGHGTASALLGVITRRVPAHVVAPGRWVDGYVRRGRAAPALSLERPARVRGRARRLRWRWPRTALFPGTSSIVHRVRDARDGVRASGSSSRSPSCCPAPPTGKGLLADLYLGRLREPAMARRPHRREDVPLPGRRGDARAERARRSPRTTSSRTRATRRPACCCTPRSSASSSSSTCSSSACTSTRTTSSPSASGFKLGWGCLVFYPFFYCVGLWYAADQPNPHSPPVLLLGAAALFFAGWVLARGANLQKYFFKTAARARARSVPCRSARSRRRQARAGQRLLGPLAPRQLPRRAAHGDRRSRSASATRARSGRGSTRSTTWCCCVPRQLDDDRRCAEKYGPLWDEYRRAVPYRIIPFVY